MADLVLQLSLLRDRLEFLESGELPPGLRARLISSVQEVYAGKLATIEMKLSSLEARVSALEEGLKRESQERQALAQSVGKEIGALRGGDGKEA